MQDFTNQRDVSTLDEIWVLEHHRVFTQGQAGKAEHLLNQGDIPLVQSDRGGQVTYHGPGQLMIYLMLDLKRLNIGVRALVTHMEEALIDCLSGYGINAATKAGAPGVYVEGCKIASLGLRVRKGCSFHGLALNVDMDLSPFERINPCGYAGLKMVQMKDFHDATDVIELDLVASNLCKKIIHQLQYTQVNETQDAWVKHL
jgi:lipoyl(octanoyl) transferase|tara:strand:- start:3467 stop:4069 length:603 start_codon:yes stop_codon:yes gene_type:complete